MEELKEGYIFDYISGIQVKETPEEIEAVQPFSKILVDDYGYPKENIHTRPQYRVKVRPSDVKKEYPVDIAVFNSSTHSEDNIHIIIECKKKSRKDGLSQLQDYLGSMVKKDCIFIKLKREEKFSLRRFLIYQDVVKG